MPHICFTFPQELPIGLPIMKDGKQIGKVIGCGPYQKRFAITAEATEQMVLDLHKPIQTKMTTS